MSDYKVIKTSKTRVSLSLFRIDRSVKITAKHVMYTGIHQCFCQMVARCYIKFYRIYKGLLVVVSVNYLVNW